MTGIILGILKFLMPWMVGGVCVYSICKLLGVVVVAVVVLLIARLIIGAIAK